MGYLSTHSVKLSDDVRLQQTLSDDVLSVIKGKDVVVVGLLKIAGGDQFTEAGVFRLSGGIGGAAANGSIAAPGVKICWPRHGYPYANGGYAWKFFYDTIPYSAASGSVVPIIYGSQGPGNGRYALWNALGLFLREDFEKFRTWF